MVNWSRIKGILVQEYYITKRSLEVLVDLPLFSFIGLILFGFITNFLSISNKTNEPKYLLLGLILWEVIRITQYSMSVEAMWNVWSRNLSNMFVSPLTIWDYFIAQMISSVSKTIIIVLVISVISYFMFSFNLLSVGMLNLLIYFINLTIFAWTTGILILGFIFRFGTRIQSLAWGIIFLFQPLTAAAFPLSVLPKPLQTFALIFPPTYIFEASRQSLNNGSTNWGYVNTAFILNVFYFIIAIVVFYFLFKKSKDTGQFARNEG